MMKLFYLGFVHYRNRDMGKVMITKLENLPNEILTNIIEYIAIPHDIYRAFHGLNQRFNTILRFIRLSIDIFHEDKQNLFFTHYFSAHCDRLRLIDICPAISLIRFPRLYSLTVMESTESQINSIQSQALPLLEYLATPPNMMIFECLFGNEKQRWHRLRSCNFFFCPLPTLKSTWKSNYNLCVLSGITCSRTILSQLVKLVPSLKHLRIIMLVGDDSIWNLPLSLINLVSLRIGFSHLIYDDLLPLMSPNLRRLYLEVQSISVPIDFAYLGSLLVSKSQKLKQFNCDYSGQIPDINEIREAHPVFQNITLVQSYAKDIVKLICKNMKKTQNQVDQP